MLSAPGGGAQASRAGRTSTRPAGAHGQVAKALVSVTAGAGGPG